MRVPSKMADAHTAIYRSFADLLAAMESYDEAIKAGAEDAAKNARHRYRDAVRLSYQRLAARREGRYRAG